MLNSKLCLPWEAAVRSIVLAVARVCDDPTMPAPASVGDEATRDQATAARWADVDALLASKVEKIAAAHSDAVVKMLAAEPEIQIESRLAVPIEAERLAESRLAGRESNLWRYDPKRDRWTQLDGMPEGLTKMEQMKWKRDNKATAVLGSPPPAPRLKA